MGFQSDVRRRPHRQAKCLQDCEKANQANHETDTVGEDPAGDHGANFTFATRASGLVEEDRVDWIDVGESQDEAEGKATDR